MKDNILNFDSYKNRKLESLQEKLPPLKEIERTSLPKKEDESKFQILKLRKDIDALHELVMSL